MEVGAAVGGIGVAVGRIAVAVGGTGVAESAVVAAASEGDPPAESGVVTAAVGAALSAVEGETSPDTLVLTAVASTTLVTTLVTAVVTTLVGTAIGLDDAAGDAVRLGTAALGLESFLLEPPQATVKSASATSAVAAIGARVFMWLPGGRIASHCQRRRAPGQSSRFTNGHEKGAASLPKGKLLAAARRAGWLPETITGPEAPSSKLLFAPPIGPRTAGRRLAADNTYMDDVTPAPLVPADGDATIVMQRGVGSPLSWEGAFAGQRGFQISVSGADQCPFEAEEDVLLASGKLGNRIASLARFKGVHTGRAIFTKLSPWRPVDTRANPRYRISMAASVRHDAVEFPASVLDVSLGGAALVMETAPAAQMFDVRIGTRPDAPFLPCRTVSRQEQGGSEVLHVRFGTMTVQSHNYVAQLVGDLCASLEPGLMAG
ncbi:MAG: PilZ domain-containing protein [Tepidiformaceae bacterium]